MVFKIFLIYLREFSSSIVIEHKITSRIWYTLLNGWINYSVGVLHKRMGAKTIIWTFVEYIYICSGIAARVGPLTHFCRFQPSGFVSPRFLSFPSFSKRVSQAVKLHMQLSCMWFANSLSYFDLCWSIFTSTGICLNDISGMVPYFPLAYYSFLKFYFISWY